MSNFHLLHCGCSVIGHVFGCIIFGKLWTWCRTEVQFLIKFTLKIICGTFLMYLQKPRCSCNFQKSCIFVSLLYFLFHSIDSPRVIIKPITTPTSRVPCVLPMTMVTPACTGAWCVFVSVVEESYDVYEKHWITRWCSNKARGYDFSWWVMHSSNVRLTTQNDHHPFMKSEEATL